MESNKCLHYECKVVFVLLLNHIGTYAYKIKLLVNINKLSNEVFQLKHVI